MTTDRSENLIALERCWDAQSAYVGSGGEDFAAMAASLHPEIVLRQADSLPYGGEWRGHRGIEGWMKEMTRAWDSVEVEHSALFEHDDSIVVLATFEARARATGTRVRMPICEVIRFADSLPLEWRVFYLDTAAINRVLGAVAA